MGIRVLVEHTLPRSAAHLLCLRRIRDQLAVGGDGRLRALDDEQLATGLEPALDSLVRIRDDGRGGRCQLEWTRGRGSCDRGVGSPRHVEVDTRRRDRACEDVEWHVTQKPSRARIALEVEPAEPEVEVGRVARRLADHRLHPVPTELVAVAVEEHVELLLDLLRREELGVGSPVQCFGSAGAEFEQSPDPTFRVREHEVVLPRIGAVVRVEPGVHPAVFGQAHRDVAVVEDDRDAVALAQCIRDTPQVRHRNSEDDHCVRLLGVDQSFEMALPTRSHPSRDRLAREFVERRLLGARFRATQVAIALHPSEHVADRLVGLAFAVRRVRCRPPPR